MDSDQIIHSQLFHENQEEELNKFIHLCINEVCGCTGPEFHQFSNLNWSKEIFNNVHKFIITLLNNPVCLYADEDKMITEYYELPKHAQQTMLTSIRARKSQLTDALLLKYSSKHISTLYNFDWRLKYVMGSSKMASIKEPLLQLDLILKEKDCDTILGLEFNKDELESLITTLENAVQ